MLIKTLLVTLAVFNTIYAAALYNGHEASLATQILDQFMISGLALLAFWEK